MHAATESTSTSTSTRANDERANNALDIQAQRSGDDVADVIRNAFEKAFHLSGVQAYLEYYQL